MPSEPLGAGAVELLRPQWPAPPGILAGVSTRRGGVSPAPFDTLDLRLPEAGQAAGDQAAAVVENRRRFTVALGASPVWLHQVHGAEVVRLGPAALWPGAPVLVADAAVSSEPGLACAVLVADCLPVLFCSADGRVVGAAHAGWRGLAAGVLERTAEAVCEAASCPPAGLLAWLGPCIGPRRFEVGAEVLEAFGAEPCGHDQPRFAYRARADGSPRWLADLPGIARDRLSACGVGWVGGAAWCTFEDSARFYSFRRDRRTGRMAAAIAIAAG